MSTKNTAPTDARLTAWNPNILLNLIIPAKIKIVLIKFKIMTEVLKDLFNIKRVAWITEMIKKNPRNELG